MNLIPRICTLVFACCMAFAPAFGSLLAPWVGPNVRLGEDPAALPAGDGLNQAEPHVARSVVDPDLLLATFQEGRFPDGGARNNGYAVSEDGGFHWRRALNPSLTVVNGGPYYRATDPVGAISRDGTLYLNSLVAVDPEFNLGRLVVQRSEDSGLTWTYPIPIYTGTASSPDYRIFPDKNWMTVNDYPGVEDGRVVVTWTNFRTIQDELTTINDYLIMAAHSDDKGQTWSEPVFVTPPRAGVASPYGYQGSQPVFLPGGGLAIVYHNFLQTRLEVRYSPDGGETFPFEAVPLHARYYLYDAPNMRDGAFLPSVGIARETGDLYVAYTSRASDTSTYGDIYFIRSDRTNPGTSPPAQPDWRFRAPVRISGISPIRVTCLSTIAVSPDGQNVFVYFYDNRNGTPGNGSGDFYGVLSIDGGSTWSQPFRMTESTFALNKATSTSIGYMIGDYFGFAPPQGPGQAAVAVWIDTRLASADPWSARIGSLKDGVFASWLQANLPFARNQGDSDGLRYADPDRDGTPNLLEYVTGQSPRLPETPPALVNGLSLLRLNGSTDPAVQVSVSGGTGRWPVFRQVSGQVAQVSAYGAGYWSQLTWLAGGELEHLEFTLNGTERWYLLDETAPLRWIMDSGGGWIWSSWFGYLYTGYAPWLFHRSLGWIYDFKGVLYSPVFADYLYPSPSIHPWVYKQDGSFLYLLDDSPWVYDTGAGAWVRTY